MCLIDVIPLCYLFHFHCFVYGKVLVLLINLHRREQGPISQPLVEYVFTGCPGLAFQPFQYYYLCSYAQNMDVVTFFLSLYRGIETPFLSWNTSWRSLLWPDICVFTLVGNSNLSALEWKYMDAILTLVKYYLCSFILFTHLTSRSTEVIRITKLENWMGVHIRYADIALAVIPTLDYFCLYRVLKWRLNEHRRITQVMPKRLGSPWTS